MLKNLISQGNFALWPQISLALFLTCFIGILLYVYRRGSTVHYDRMANMVGEESQEAEVGRDRG